MIFKKNKIKGVRLIKPEPFKDERGVFRRVFCIKEFKKNKINSEIKQANISENRFKYTLRGFHFQTNPYSEDKTLTCIKGSIYDIIVDLRPSSKTYMQWSSFKINENNRYSIHVPKGCANAFLTLKSNTIVQYGSSQFYKPKHEKGIRFDDLFLNLNGPINQKLSHRRI